MRAQALSVISAVPGNLIKDAGTALEAAVGSNVVTGEVHSVGGGTSGAHTRGFGGGSREERREKEQEDADMALAMSLQAEWEEEERRIEQQRAAQQQQMQRQQAAPVVGSVVSPPSRGGVVGGAQRAQGGAPAARQRAGAQGGIAADQMVSLSLSMHTNTCIRRFHVASWWYLFIQCFIAIVFTAQTIRRHCEASSACVP